MRILIVDDDEPTRALLATSVGRAGHAAVLAASYHQGETLATEESFDLVLLDVMLPDGSGVELCRQLRAARVSTPILLLTARGAVGDRVAGLDAGADDYLSKPFSVSELLARVRALGRRGPVLREETIRIRGLDVDLPGRRILLHGKVLPMTARELAIVEVLVKHRGRVISREDLMDAVWGKVNRSVAGSLEVLIARVRRKLGDNAGLLRTVRGLGYAFEDA